MADSIHRVGIEVDVDTGTVAARLKAVEQQLSRMQKTIARMDRKSGGVNDTFNKLDKRLNKLRSTIGGLTSMFAKFFSTMAKFGFLAMAGELAIFTAGLLAIKLALITGRAAASLYQIALKGISVTAASVATGLAVAAAAMRQFQEAQLAPMLANQPGAPLTALGRRNAAGRLGRGLGATTSGLLGMEGSQQVVAALARAGIGGRQGIGLAQGLGNLTNFDPKAMMQIISALGGAIKGGGLSPAISAVTSAVGFRGGTVTASNAAGLIGAISSGSLTAGAFQGQGNALSNTFIGSAKTAFSGVRDQFADTGLHLLEPMRQTFLEIAKILRENMLSLQLIIQKFGADSMGPTMVTIFDRMMKFITTNIIDHLDNIKEMGENFVGFFRSIKNFFHAMGDWLGKYEPAANVIIDMFRAASGANKSSLFRNFAQGLTDNADKIKEFGAGMGRLFGGIFSIFESGNQGFFSGIDRILAITDAIVDRLIPALVNFFAATAPLAERLPTIIEGLSHALNLVAPAIHMLAKVLAGFLGALGGLAGKTGGISGAVAGFVGLKAMGMVGRGGKAKRAAMMSSMMGWNMEGTYNRMFDSANLNTRWGRAKGNLALGLTKFGPTARGGTGLTGAGALGTVMGGAIAAGGIYGAYQEGGGAGNYMMSGLGGAATGASIGTMVLGPGIGTAIGAAVGGALGLGGGILGGWLGGKAQDKRTRRALSNLQKERMFAGAMISMGGAGTRDIYNKQTQALELWEAAQDAAGGKMEGDTAEFRALLKFLGEDPDKVNRDNFFANLTNTGYEDDLRRNQQTFERTESTRFTQAIKTANAALSSFSGVVEMTQDSMLDFAEKLGFDVGEMSNLQAGALGIVAAAERLMINRDQAILPDFGSSSLAMGEARASLDASFNSIVAGDFSVTNLEDYVSKKAGYEVQIGNSVDIAAASGLFDLLDAADAGLFGTNTNAIVNFANSGMESMARQMVAENYGTYDEIMGYLQAGDIEALDNMVQGKADFRGAIAGDPNMDIAKRTGILSDNGIAMDAQFMTNVGKFLPGGGFDAAFANDFLSTGFTLTPEMMMNEYQANVSDADLHMAITRALVEGGMGGEVEILRAILDQLGGLDNLQQWELIINQGSVTGGSTQIGARSLSGGPTGIIEITDEVQEAIDSGIIKVDANNKATAGFSGVNTSRYESDDEG